MKTLLKEFKEFAVKGNVVDMAVGVIVGGAFGKIVTSLVNDVINFAGREWRAIVVFDGGGNANSAGEAQTVGGVRIVFSPAEQSADKVIEKLAHDARERQVETLVVSSDATIQDTVFGFGIDRMSAEGFSRELGAYYEEARLDDTPRVSKKNTVAERIPADTLAKLMRMRDGR